MKKTFQAFLSALLITALLAGGMYMIGKDALGVSTAKAAVAATAMPADTYTPTPIPANTETPIPTETEED